MIDAKQMTAVPNFQFFRVDEMAAKEEAVQKLAASLLAQKHDEMLRAAIMGDPHLGSNYCPPSIAPTPIRQKADAVLRDLGREFSNLIERNVVQHHVSKGPLTLDEAFPEVVDVPNTSLCYIKVDCACHPPNTPAGLAEVMAVAMARKHMQMRVVPKEMRVTHPSAPMPTVVFALEIHADVTPNNNAAIHAVEKHFMQTMQDVAACNPMFVPKPAPPAPQGPTIREFLKQEEPL